MKLKVNMKQNRYKKLLGLVIIVGAIIGCTSNMNSKTVIYDTIVNYSENPIGIEEDGIVFGWKMDSKIIGQSQKSYQIVVLDESGNEIWNTGEVSSDVSIAIPYLGPKLNLETRYSWNVTVGCSNGELINSEQAYFETGTNFRDASWIYYKPEIQNCFNNEYTIQVTPTIQKDGFTLYFGIKNEDNRFVWSFSEGKLIATKETQTGTIDLGSTNLAGIISLNSPFNLSIAITANTITTSINNEEINTINHSFAIEKPYVGLMASAAQSDFRTRVVSKPAQSASFRNFMISVDGKSEKIGDSVIALTVPETQQSAGGFPGMRGGPQGEMYMQDTYNGKPVEYIKESTAMPMFRTEQTIKSNVESARLYVTSLGIYDAFINGKEVMQKKDDGTFLDDVFSPGWTNYNDYIYYHTYDVTDYLEGDNLVLGAEVGTGWYAGIIGREYYGEIGETGVNELSLLAKLVINYFDGSQDVISTNTENWVATDNGPVLSNDFFIGEVYDARLEANVKGWESGGFDASNWSKVSKLDYDPILVGGNENTAYMLEELKLTPEASEETYIYDPENIDFSSDLTYGEVVPEKVDLQKEIKLEKGKKLMIDLGQNIAGVAGISLSGPEGTMVKLSGAEMLNDGMDNPNVSNGGGSCGPKGTLYWTGLTRARDAENAWYTDTYYLNNEDIQDYRASFTFHGFRYLEISTDEDITLHSIYAQPITSLIKQTGVIETNNSDINQLHKNTLWSQMTNHITIPTDCPNRSERLGWSGDIVVFAETSLYNFDNYNFMDNYMDIAVNYADNNGGRFGTTMPGPSNGDAVSSGGFGGGGSTNAGWTDVGIILTWSLYQQTGDVSILEENYDLLSDYMDGVMEEGLRAGYGDWVALQTTSGDFMAGVYQAYDAILMSKIAEAIGNSSDSKNTWMNMIG